MGKISTSGLEHNLECSKSPATGPTQARVQGLLRVAGKEERMSRQQITFAIRVLVGIAFLIGLFVSPARYLASHDVLQMTQAEADRHAELAAQFDEHGHTHDDGVADEKRSGHLHGHNPADHSHETAAAPLLTTPLLVGGPKSWLAGRALALDPSYVLSFERPPRS